MKRLGLAVAAILATVAVADTIITPGDAPTSINIDGKQFAPPISNNTVYDARLTYLLNYIASRTTSSPVVINAKSQPYGAKGDGITDDTTSIRATFAAASLSGGEVYFPAGVYCVRNNARVTGDNIRIAGNSSGTAILKACGNWTNPNPDVAAIISLMNLDGGRISNIEIEHLGFLGPGVIDGGTASGPKAITAIHGDDISIHDIATSNFGNEVIWGTEGRNWNVSNNNIVCTPDAGQLMWPGAAIQGNFNNSRINGNRVENCYVGIGASGNNIAITGNNVVTPLLTGIGTGDQDESGLFVSVAGNTVTIVSPPTGTLGSPISAIGIGGSSRAVSVTGNSIAILQTTGGSANIRAIYGAAAGGVHNISNNNIYLDQNLKNIAMLGFNAEAAGTTQVTYVLSGNTIDMVREGAVTNYGWSAASAGGTPTINMMLNGNFVTGITRANSGFCIYGSQSSGGTVRIHGNGNVCADGRQTYISKDLNSSYHDNAPIIFTNTTTGDAGVQINP